MLVPPSSDEMLFQGPIALERARFCLDCEAIFTELPGCPSCSSGVIWPLATWLSPTEPRPIMKSRPVLYSPSSHDKAAEGKAVA
jgi:hypothetical protein